MCDCGPGGAVVLSSEAFHRAMQLGQQGPKWCATERSSPHTSVHGGGAGRLQQQQLSAPLPDPPAASVLCALTGSVAVYAGDHVMEKLDAGAAKPMPLFMAVPAELEARVPHLPPMRYTKVWTVTSVHGPPIALHLPQLFDPPPSPLLLTLTCLQMLALGTLSAPVGTVTIVFACVVGAAQLLSDIPEAAREALTVFQV